MAKRILVIDDEAAVREVFSKALTFSGYTVETAANGEEGLQRAQASPPDLVFLDLRMPGMNGVEVLRHLHADSPALPIYIVTAFHKDFMEPLRQAAGEGLRFQVADKPLTVDQITAIADGVLKGRAASV